MGERAGGWASERVGERAGGRACELSNSPGGKIVAPGEVSFGGGNLHAGSFCSFTAFCSAVAMISLFVLPTTISTGGPFSSSANSTEPTTESAAEHV